MGSRSYQCLSCRLSAALQTLPRYPSACRSFTTTAPRPIRKRRNINLTKHTPVPRAHEAVAEEDRELAARAAHIRPYTAREKQLLAMRYTKEQMEVIDAGEAAISPHDMVSQGRLRGDAGRITYLDDFATIRPLVDIEARGRTGEDGKESERKSKKALPIPTTHTTTAAEDASAAEPHMLRLSQQTGLSRDQIRTLRIKNLVTHRVVNQTRMGKIQSLYFLTIAGNQAGMLGIGEGKAAEDEDGRRQAMMAAIRNMKPIPRYEERTIYGDVTAKVAGTVVELQTRPPGFGNRCQHLIFELARAAGISDLAARTPRSRNKMNVVKAAFQALTSQRLPEDVARSRGRKMVDVRSVYYGGQVF